MPSSSSFSSFLGLPLGFLPGVVVVFRVLVAPLFLLPFGRPRGLLGVGTSLGSFGGCLRGRPRPRFSAPSFSCLEARGWLDFELDSLIFPRQQSRRGATAGRELGCRPAVRAPSCRERRCWALRTGLAPPPPPPPPLVANADLKPGERAEALRGRRRRVLAALAPAGYLYVTSRRGGAQKYSTSPEGWRGAGS